MKDCEKIIQKVLDEGRSFLLANEAKQICNFHKIPTPSSYVAFTAKEAALKAKVIGFPVVLKIMSSNILHKSEVGGVILNIMDELNLKIEYEKLITKFRKLEPSAKVEGIMVERMMTPSTEVIIGAIRDSQFGPSIMFGMGGIFTEIYDDVAFRIAPIDEIDALSLIHELKGYRILEGVRGRPSADINSIVELLIKVSNLMMEHNDISQLDLNPVIVYSAGLYAVDSRIILRRTKFGK